MNINELKIVISAKIDNFKKSITEVKKELNQLTSINKLTSREIQDSFDSMNLDDLKLQLEMLEKLFIKETSWASQLKTELEKAGLQYQQALKDKEDFSTNKNNLPWTQFEEGWNAVQRGIKQSEEAQKYWQSQLDKSEATTRQIKENIKACKLSIKEAKKNAANAKKEATNINKIVNGILSLFKRMIIRKAIMAVLTSIKESIDLLARFDKSLNGVLGYNQALSNLTSTFKQLSATIGAVAGELLVGLAPSLTFVFNILNKVAEHLSALLAMINGKTTYTVANPDYWKDYADKLNESVKAQKKLIGGFDELNVFTKNQTTDTQPSEMYTTKELSDLGKGIANWISDLTDGKGALGGLVASIAGVIAAVKLLNALFGNKNSALKKQTDLEKNNASQLSSVLVPALAAAALGVAGLKTAFDTLKEKLPILEPQVQLQPAFSKIQQFVQNFSTFKAPDIIPTISLVMITSGIEAIKSLWNKLKLPSLEVQFNESSINNFISRLQSTFSNIKLPEIKPVLNTNPILAAITLITTAFSTFWNKNKIQTEEGTSTFKDKWTYSLTNVLNTVKVWSNQFASNLTTSFSNIKTNIINWATSTANSFARWASNTAGNVANATSNWAKNTYSALTNMGKNVSNFISSSSSNFAKWCNNTASNISKWGSNIASNIGNTLNTAWQNFKNFMTATGEKISGWFKQNQTAILSTVAVAGIAAAAIALAPYTGGLSLAPLAFANGGVVNKPTQALIGEYPGARTNPEIVTPESKMREVLIENNGDLLNGFAQMTRQVISAINDVDMVVSIGDDVIAHSASRGNNAYKRMTGNSLI